jgi:hypothetical protein
MTIGGNNLVEMTRMIDSGHPKFVILFSNVYPLSMISEEYITKQVTGFKQTLTDYKMRIFKLDTFRFTIDVKEVKHWVYLLKIRGKEDIGKLFIQISGTIHVLDGTTNLDILSTYNLVLKRIKETVCLLESDFPYLIHHLDDKKEDNK